MDAIAAKATYEPWVTAQQVANHLGVVKESVYRWREGRGLPAHKIGRLWKFQLPEVDCWVRIGAANVANSGNALDADIALCC